MDLTIGVDVGGTKIAAGAVDPTGRIVENVRVQTPATTAQAVEDGIVEAVRRVLQSHDAVAVGLAVAGFVDEKRATLRFACTSAADSLCTATAGSDEAERISRQEQVPRTWCAPARSLCLWRAPQRQARSA